MDGSACKFHNEVVWSHNFFLNYFLTVITFLFIEYMKRVIVHPSFINASFSEVERCLQSMDQGDAVFRPSSKVSFKRKFHSSVISGMQ